MITVDQIDTDTFIVGISGEAARTLFASDDPRPRSDLLLGVIAEACAMLRHLEAACQPEADIDDGLPF